MENKHNPSVSPPTTTRNPTSENTETERTASTSEVSTPNTPTQKERRGIQRGMNPLDRSGEDRSNETRGQHGNTTSDALRNPDDKSSDSSQSAQPSQPSDSGNGSRRGRGWSSVAPNSKKISRRTYMRLGRSQKNYHELNLPDMTLDGETIVSYDQACKIVDERYRGVKHLADYQRWMDLLRKDLALLAELRGRKYLDYGEIAKLARMFGIAQCTIKARVLDAVPPKMLAVLRDAISIPEAEEKIREMCRINDGITSMEEVDRRIDNYYAAREYRQAPSHEKDREMAERYFPFLEILAEGGAITTIARRAGMDSGTARRYYYGMSPWMIQLAACIPAKDPKKGHLWLPLTTGDKNSHSDFIEVPLDVSDHTQVLSVIEHLQSLKSQRMRELQQEFEDTNMVDAFMYVLGAVLSDGSFRKTHDSNHAGSRVTISLGRAYEWSERFGKAVCHYLGKLGIKTYRQKDTEFRDGYSSFPSSGAYLWQSGFSVLLTWMRRTCLGLKDGMSKTNDSIDGEWILGAPFHWRKPFIQGIADGDGCATVKSQHLSLATSSNTKFFIDLLGTFGLQSHVGDGAVEISAHDSIHVCKDVEMFRYAESRKHNLNKLSDMLASVDYSRVITPEQKKIIFDLRKSGLSWGSISESLFDQFGYTWPYYAISRRYKKWKKEGN